MIPKEETVWLTLDQMSKRFDRDKGVIGKHIRTKDYLLKGYVINDRHYQDVKYMTNILNEYKVAGGYLPIGDSMLEFLMVDRRVFQLIQETTDVEKYRFSIRIMLFIKMKDND